MKKEKAGKKEAAKVALRTIEQWLDQNADYEMKVILSCYDRKTYDAYQETVKNNERE